MPGPELAFEDVRLFGRRLDVVGLRLRVHLGFRRARTGGRRRRPRASRSRPAKVRGYFSKSSPGRNCRRLTKIVATTASPWLARLRHQRDVAFVQVAHGRHQRDALPAGIFSAARRPAMVSWICIGSSVAVFRGGEGAVLDGRDVGRDGAFDALRLGHEVLDEAALLARDRRPACRAAPAPGRRSPGPAPMPMVAQTLSARVISPASGEPAPFPAPSSPRRPAPARRRRPSCARRPPRRGPARGSRRARAPTAASGRCGRRPARRARP